MAPDASHDEVKRAFTERALRFHPDRQGDASPEARERAEWRMREVNESWAVLRNPATRAAYDAQLAAAVVAADGPADPARPAGGTAHRTDPWDIEPEVAEVEPDDGDDEPEMAHGPRRLLQYGPVLVGGAVLLFILVFTAYASAKDPGVDVQTRERLAVGACVIVQPGETGASGPQVTEVPCSGLRSGRIVSKVDFPRPCPLNTQAVVLTADKIALCLRP